MAGSWKKITDKVDKAPVSGPHASDWEAMNAKIGAHPSLATPKGRGGFWLKTGLSILLLAVLGLGYVMFWSSSIEKNNSTESSEQVESPIVEPINNIEETNVVNKATENSEINESKVGVNELISEQTTTPQAITENENTEELVVPVAAVVEKESMDNRNTGIVEIQEEPTREVVDVDEVVMASVPLNLENKKSVDEASENENQEIFAAEDIAVSDDLLVNDDLTVFKDEVESAEEIDDQDLVTEDLEPKSSQEMVAEENEFEEIESPFLLEEIENNPEPILAAEAQEELDFPGELEKESEELQEIESESLVENEESASSASANPINLRSAGFSLNGLNVGAGYSTDFSGNLYGTGIGVDVDIQRGGLLLNTGIHYYQMNTLSEFINYSYNTDYNTTFNTVWDTTVTTIKDSAWVIDSAYAGHWADKSYTTTSISSTTDTILDSTVTKIETKENRRVKLSYIELPIMAGHRFRFNRLAVDVYGGVVLNQLTTATMEGVDIQKKFGMDAVIQPAVRFYLKPEWSVFGRAGLRYGLVANAYRPQKLYSNFQIGLTYHW